jgi:hypothetical protein
MKIARYICITSAVMLFAGCAYPRHRKDEVITIAFIAARLDERDLANYKRPVARYWLIPERHCWEVLFIRRRHVRDGVDLSVLVDDQTGEADVRVGMR